MGFMYCMFITNIIPSGKLSNGTSLFFMAWPARAARDQSAPQMLWTARLVILGILAIFHDENSNENYFLLLVIFFRILQIFHHGNRKSSKATDFIAEKRSKTGWREGYFPAVFCLLEGQLAVPAPSLHESGLLKKTVFLVKLVKSISI